MCPTRNCSTLREVPRSIIFFAELFCVCWYGLFLAGRDLSQNFVAVNIGIDLLPYLDDLAFGRDEEGFAVGELHRAKVLDRDTVSINDLMVGSELL